MKFHNSLAIQHILFQKENTNTEGKLGQCQQVIYTTHWKQFQLLYKALK